MRKLELIFLVSVFSFGKTLLAQCVDDPPANASKYDHKHQAYNFNGDQPYWLEDRLVTWSSKSGELCFALDTWGTNGHECGAQGMLERVSRGHYRFNADICSIDFMIASQSIELKAADVWRRSAECPKRFSCGMHGSIESGIFTRLNSK